MSGERNGVFRGITPRAVEQMISEIIVLRQNGWDVSLTTSMVRYSTYVHAQSDKMICGGASAFSADKLCTYLDYLLKF